MSGRNVKMLRRMANAIKMTRRTSFALWNESSHRQRRLISSAVGRRPKKDELILIGMTAALDKLR